jgi:hypothetical protein
MRPAGKLLEKTREEVVYLSQCEILLIAAASCYCILLVKLVAIALLDFLPVGLSGDKAV